jgi:molybdate transport system ATP-binding protein
VILDDPYTGLDQKSRARLSAGIDGLLKQSTPAILLVSSRWEEIPAGITHLLLVQAGQVTGQGRRQAVEKTASFHELRAAPRTAQAAAPGEPQAAALQARAAAYAAQLQSSGITGGQEVIHLEQVSVSYPGVDVLREVTWSVFQGERWALTGPNGAGKSTLLSLILADHPQAYRNHLRLFGRRRGSGESIWEIKRKIGWVSPELQIFYERPLTCFEAVCSGFFDSVGLYRQPDEAQQAAAFSWLQAFHLDGLANRPLLSLSTGQQRLVLLARALVKHPPLLVLDEPCQGLDTLQRSAFIDLLDALCDQTPLTLIYVSHDPRELPQAISHHLRLENGRSVSKL